MSETDKLDSGNVPTPEQGPELVTKLEPISESASEPVPETMPEQELDSIPELTSEPMPETTSAPAPETTTEPIFEPIDEAMPEVAPESIPDPTPETTDKKTLKLRSPEELADAPTLKKKGRGWEISEKRLDELHAHARELRRHSSDAHKALAERFSNADMGRYAFKRHAVVGSAIVDFTCHNLGMAIAIDEEGANEAIAKRRDKSLEAVGIRVMRIAASDITDNMDAVLQRITAGMRMRISDKRVARARHREESTPR